MDDVELPSGKARTTQILHFYSDLHVNEEIYQQLRLWRREQASKEGKAPFILASNRILRMISTFLPYTKEELMQIPGFGGNRTGLYGNRILEITSSFARGTEFPLHWVEGTIEELEFKQWMHKQKEIRIKEEIDKQSNKRKLLEEIGQGARLNDLQGRINVSRRDLILWVEELDKEGYDVDHLIDVELSEVPESEQEAAWKAFAEMGERYLKPVMIRVMPNADIKGKELDQAYEWLRLLRIRFRKAKSMKSLAS